MKTREVVEVNSVTLPRHEVEVSGQLNAPAAKPAGKEPKLPIG
jgi:hypothetical protein